MRTGAVSGEAEETGITGCGAGREEDAGAVRSTEGTEGNDGRRLAESICATLRRSRLIVCGFPLMRTVKNLVERARTLKGPS